MFANLLLAQWLPVLEPLFRDILSVGWLPADRAVGLGLGVGCRLAGPRCLGTILRGTGAVKYKARVVVG